MLLFLWNNTSASFFSDLHIPACPFLLVVLSSSLKTIFAFEICVSLPYPLSSAANTFKWPLVFKEYIYLPSYYQLNLMLGSLQNTCTPQGLTAYRMRLTFLICCPKPFKCGSTHCRATYLPWVVLHVCPILYQLPGFGEVGSSTWSLCSFHLLKPFLPLVPSTNAASFPAFPYPGNLSFIRSVYLIFYVSIIFSFMLFMEEAFSTVLFIIVL